MSSAPDLLNLILDQSEPDEVIRLPLHQARMIASLEERELGGELKQAIRKMGVAPALERRGLFSRRVVIIGDAETFTVMDDAESR